MQYSPKLKKAAEEIKAILKKHDIAASVILHTPGFSEYINQINTTYSCASFKGDEIRIRAKLKEDFNGDKVAWNRKVTDTVNMIQHIADVTGQTSLNFFNLLDMVKKIVDISSDPGTHSSHIEQNN